MAKIVYKEGYEGQNKLSCIEGIEIDLFNGQKALIYPKYALKKMLTPEKIYKWDAAIEEEVEALKVTDTSFATQRLLDFGSPAAEWTSQFCSDERGRFNLPSLLAAMEIRHQAKEIDALANTIEGTDLLKNYFPSILSCSRCSKESCWYIFGRGGYTDGSDLDHSNLAVPTILYR